MLQYAWEVSILLYVMQIFLHPQSPHVLGHTNRAGQLCTITDIIIFRNYI
jgi:hypothetical protein